MPGSATQFAQLLREGITAISALTGQPKGVIHDELGYAIGRVGGSAIAYWSYGDGHLPRKDTDVEQLAHELVRRGHLDREWLVQFLTSAGYPDTTQLYDELFGESPSEYGGSLPTSRTPRHNLPTQTTRFIGREGELAEIRRLLLDEPDCRLLNLCGPGGIGKTRLALAAAAQTLHAFFDGVVFVPLAPIGQMEDVVPAIAEALHLNFHGQAEPRDQLLDYLHDKQLLLVVDNFEHLLASSDLLSQIVVRAPAVTLLVTSRERLRLQEEWVYEVQGLPFPTPSDLPTSKFLADGADEALSHYASVQLFMQRARQVKSGFTPTADEMAAIGRICRLVEGMPLGLELAAPWIRTLSCYEIASEIARSLDFLTTSLRNVPPRHHSLYATLNHSWQLLAPDEQRVFACLSVFRGSFTREAAEQVACASLHLLAALNDKSLLRRTATQTYEMHEFARQFAAAKLQERGVEEETRTRHVAYFMALAEEELKQLDASWHFPEHIRQRRNQTSR